MKVIVTLLIIVASLVGIADASYLTYQKSQASPPPCHPVFKCADVLNSPWSSIGPVPLPLLGVAFYVSVLISGIAYYLGLTHVKIGSRQVPMSGVLIGLGIFGSLFSLYLVTIMGIILKAWCLYCLISAVNCLILAVLTTTLYLSDRKGSPNL